MESKPRDGLGVSIGCPFNSAGRFGEIVRCYPQRRLCLLGAGARFEDQVACLCALGFGCVPIVLGLLGAGFGCGLQSDSEAQDRLQLSHAAFLGGKQGGEASGLVGVADNALNEPNIQIVHGAGVLRLCEEFCPLLRRRLHPLHPGSLTSGDESFDDLFVHEPIRRALMVAGVAPKFINVAHHEYVRDPTRFFPCCHLNPLLLILPLFSRGTPGVFSRSLRR